MASTQAEAYRRRCHIGHVLLVVSTVLHIFTYPTQAASWSTDKPFSVYQILSIVQLILQDTHV